MSRTKYICHYCPEISKWRFIIQDIKCSEVVVFVLVFKNYQWNVIFISVLLVKLIDLCLFTFHEHLFEIVSEHFEIKYISCIIYYIWFITPNMYILMYIINIFCLLEFFGWINENIRAILIHYFSIIKTQMFEYVLLVTWLHVTIMLYKK